jgi:hypothetical protein
MNNNLINSETFYSILIDFQNIIKDSNFMNHVYFVGGCVRDNLLRRDIKDIDIVVDLPDGGKQFAYYLKDKGLLKDNKVIELPVYDTYRFIITYNDKDIEIDCSQTRKINLEDTSSKATINNFGTIYDDAKCRDFTINALYYDITKLCIVSPLGNYALDLIKKHILKCCDKPAIIFNDSPIRVFRLVRFLATLKYFDVHIEEYNAIKEHSYSIANIPWQHINAEMDPVCRSGSFGNRDDILELLHYIFSEDCDNIPTFLHNAPKYEYVNKIRTWAEVVPQYMLNTMYKDGYKPEYIEDVKQMKFSNKEFSLIKDIYTLVSKLMNIYKKGNIKDNKQENYFRLLMKYAYNNKNGDEITWNAITIACSYFNTIITSETLRENGFLPRGFCNNNCFIPDLNIHDFIGYKLPITGDMIKETLGIPEGPEIKQVMDFCLDEVISGNILNNDITSMLNLIKQQFGSIQN